MHKIINVKTRVLVVMHNLSQAKFVVQHVHIILVVQVEYVSKQEINVLDHTNIIKLNQIHHNVLVLVYIILQTIKRFVQVVVHQDINIK